MPPLSEIRSLYRQGTGGNEQLIKSELLRLWHFLCRFPTVPVSTIALECGYANISYFNRTFRRYMHCTPEEYRRKSGGK